MPRIPRILHVVGARPNFMKVAPVLRAMEEDGRTSNVLLHSGQHYDDAMSEVFFRELGIRRPDINLEVGSGTHGWQTARVLSGTEEVLLDGPWDLVVVTGDVNSTLAAALAAAKLGIPVAHVESGLRSRDRSMPEEINRIITDQLSELCLTPSHDAGDNLRDEGIEPSRIVFVGNVMIDTLLHTLELALAEERPFSDLEARGYVLATLHRPCNVDDPGQLAEIIDALDSIAREVPVVFPVHPRTVSAMAAAGLEFERVRTATPLPYKQMLSLQANAGLVMTDSGGMQEETTVLGVPCLTLRPSTERPITVSEGTNRLVPDRSKASILAAFGETWGRQVASSRPEGWDGRASVRIMEAIHALLGAGPQ